MVALVDRRVVLDAAGVDAAVEQIARAIAQRNKGAPLALIGIRRGGVHLAKRLAHKIEAVSKGSASQPAQEAGRIQAPAPPSAPRVAAEGEDGKPPPQDWRGLSELARAKRPALAASLHPARPIEIGAKVVLGYPRGDPNGERILEPSSRAFLEELWGRPLEVRWLEGEEAPKAPASLADEAARDARERRVRDEKSLRESIRDAVRVLDGDIDGVEVKE